MITLAPIGHRWPVASAGDHRSGCSGCGLQTFAGEPLDEQGHEGGVVGALGQPLERVVQHLLNGRLAEHAREVLVQSDGDLVEMLMVHGLWHLGHPEGRRRAPPPAAAASPATVAREDDGRMTGDRRRAEHGRDRDGKGRDSDCSSRRKGPGTWPA